MPVVFKDERVEPKIIDKDGTKFFFSVTPGKQRQARLNTVAMGSYDFGNYLNEIFRNSLTGWENLVDGDGNTLPFSIPVRDALVNDTDVFTVDDVFDVFDIGAAEGENRQKKTKKKSTSKNA